MDTRSIKDKAKYNMRLINISNDSVENIKRLAHLDSIRMIKRSEKDNLLAFDSTKVAYHSKQRPGKILVKSTKATPSRADLLSFTKAKEYLDRIQPYIFNKFLLIDDFSLKHYKKETHNIKYYSKYSIRKNNHDKRKIDYVRSKNYYEKKNRL